MENHEKEKRKAELQEKMLWGFFGFWIKKYRISYLLTLTLIVAGIIAMINIPKESSPNVDLGIISITTVYPWANPEDIDSLITEKIAKEVSGLSTIKKVESSSSLGVSSVLATIKSGEDNDDVLAEVKNRIGNIALPSDAKTPNIITIETSLSQLFSMYLYKKDENASQNELVAQALLIKEELEKLPNIKNVALSLGGSIISDGGKDESSYVSEIIIDSGKLASLGLSLSDVSSAISGFNLDQPIGNFQIDKKYYDYRLQGKYQNIYEFLETPLPVKNGGNIKLGDIAKVERKYLNESHNAVLTEKGDFIKAIALTVHKKDTSSIFSWSREAKNAIEKIFQKFSFEDFDFIYVNDIANEIIKDYSELANEGLSTLVLVFIAMLVFVGIFDAIFATITLPLAFLATFILLNSTGYSMNFLTNFSLIISFGIAIDTIIVIVQAANAKLRVWYDPKTAIALALKEYSIPTIVGVLTTIMVFLPMMLLPGIMGKFLSYIPVTIFGVLASWLVLALTINSALYLLMVKKKKTFTENPEVLEYATPAERELLLLEREWKTEIQTTELPLRTRIIAKIVEKYKNFMRKILPNAFWRRIFIIIPIITFFLGFIVLAPNIKFELMPADDNNALSYTIEWPIGMTTENMQEYLWNLWEIFANIPEIKTTTLSVNNNTANISLLLTDKVIRKENHERDVFTLEKNLSEKLGYLEEKWLNVTSNIASNWPPSSGGDIGINILSKKSENINTLKNIARDFENFLKNQEYTKNVKISSADTPGQFIFRIKKDLASQKGISPAMIYARILQETNGITVGKFADHGQDMDIKIKTSQFYDTITPDMIANIRINIGNIEYRIGDFIEITTENALEKITRKNENINITISADLDEAGDSITAMNALLDFAKSYNFPNGITFSAAWENEENAELWPAMLGALAFSVIVIFAILTLQFDSFSQPAIVFFSVFMAIPSVLFGLLITGNPYSMMFGIGFIAFMGVAVNHGIILIDAINLNLGKWMDTFTAMIEAWATRLEPMLLTTVTTVLGMIPIALKDKMWAGLGWTIIFGLIATTVITLFCVKWLYYEIFMKEKTKKTSRIKNFLKKIFSKNMRERK